MELQLIHFLYIGLKRINTVLCLKGLGYSGLKRRATGQCKEAQNSDALKSCKTPNPKHIPKSRQGLNFLKLYNGLKTPGVYVWKWKCV